MVGKAYRYRLVQPDLPPPEDYLPLLRQMHQSGWYSNFGPLATTFERGLLERFGSAGETCVTCCNATAGLSAALLASGRLGRVLIPAFTFAASLGAVRAAGMTPVVVDVDATSWVLNRELLVAALDATGATAVMLVAPFGMRRDWRAEIEVCGSRGAAVVIDDAGGLGVPRATPVQQDVFEIYSMHATKPFAVGEGGAIFSHAGNDAALRGALNFALASSEAPAWGFNGKMSELHAAVGLAQLTRIADLVERRQAFAALYREGLFGHSNLQVPQDTRAAPWQGFPVLLPHAQAAESFIADAAECGIEIRRYYRPSLSRWPEAEQYGPCPVSEDLADRMCVLPVRALTAQTRPLAHLVLDTLQRTLADGNAVAAPAAYMS
jgi:dTDP-4-amino-4,6-dideoxygalactose transaminase